MDGKTTQSASVSGNTKVEGSVSSISRKAYSLMCSLGDVCGDDLT